VRLKIADMKRIEIHNLSNVSLQIECASRERLLRSPRDQSELGAIT
jgi:hypothetical protein